MKRKYVLKSKKRFIFFLLSIFALMTSVIFSDIAYGSRENRYFVIQVQSGDTLWGIAERFCEQGDNRRYIDKLKKINSLSRSNLNVGDEIKVPFFNE